MADHKKGEKNTAANDVKKPVPASDLRDLDVLDSKIEKVKGGGKRRNPGN